MSAALHMSLTSPAARPCDESRLRRDCVLVGTAGETSEPPERANPRVSELELDENGAPSQHQVERVFICRVPGTPTSRMTSAARVTRGNDLAMRGEGADQLTFGITLRGRPAPHCRGALV